MGVVRGGHGTLDPRVRRVQHDHGYLVAAGSRLLLHDAGISTANVLTRAGLPDDLLSHDGGWLPPDRYLRLWQAIEDEAGDPLLPIRLGRAFSVQAFDPLVFAASCSRNFEVAVGRVAAYKRLVGPMRIVIARHDRATTITFEWPDSFPVPAALALSELTFLVALIRNATRECVRAERVTALSTPSPTAAYSDYFGVSIERGEKYSITLSRADELRPFLTVNDAVWAEFEPTLRARLADFDGPTTTAARVRASLLELLPSGEASVRRVAHSLAMSPRTLQRRLLVEGTSFQSVLAETREMLARHYLGQTSFSNDEVAFLLGYAGARSFIRSFVARTGSTPGEVRRRGGLTSG